MSAQKNLTNGQIVKLAGMNSGMIKQILGALGLTGASAGIGYGVGSHKGFNKGFTEGTDKGQDRAIRNLMLGLYKKLTETANSGMGVKIPGMDFDKDLPSSLRNDLPTPPTPKRPPAPPAPKKPELVAPKLQKSGNVTHSDMLKVAGLGTDLGKYLFKGIAKNKKSLDPAFKKMIADPKSQSMFGRSVLGGGALVGGGTLAGAAGLGNARGKRKGWDKGVQHGWDAGYGAGGNMALNNAGMQLEQTYGGLQGRWNALTGGARPGQDALAQLIQQYNMPSQDFRDFSNYS